MMFFRVDDSLGVQKYLSRVTDIVILSNLFWIFPTGFSNMRLAPRFAHTLERGMCRPPKPNHECYLRNSEKSSGGIYFGSQSNMIH